MKIPGLFSSSFFLLLLSVAAHAQDMKSAIVQCSTALEELEFQLLLFTEPTAQELLIFTTRGAEFEFSSTENIRSSFSPLTRTVDYFFSSLDVAVECSISTHAVPQAAGLHVENGLLTIESLGLSAPLRCRAF